MTAATLGTYLAAAIVVINALCAILARRNARRHGYNATYFFIGGLLAGPAALSASRVEPGEYVVDDDPEDEDDILARLQAPTPEPAFIEGVHAEPEPAAPGVHVEPQPAPAPVHVEPQPDFETPHITPGIEDAPVYAPEPLTPTPAAEPDLHSADIAQVDVPAPAAEPVHAEEDEDGESLVTGWGTRNGDDAVSASLIELINTEGSEREFRGLRSTPVEDDAADEKSPSAKPSMLDRLRAALSSVKVPGRKPTKADSDDAGRGDHGRFDVLDLADHLEDVESPDDADLPTVAVAPGVPTLGTCPHCSHVSYADWQGLCAHPACAMPFPVPVAAAPAEPDGDEAEHEADLPI